ncbi:MAG: molecular chaperone HtpG [Pseudomonadota bacterium]
MTETFSFQAEVTKLLHLMIHSVYSEKEIFLRELISNASDACDRLRYLAVTQSDLLGDDPDLKITLQTNADAKTLTIADNGIGMSKQELIENLGTIAKSGTKAFIDKLSQEQDSANLIGQFGVGFYAAFMVATHIEVISRKARSEEVFVWQSQGGEGFDVAPAGEDISQNFQRGTRIILHMNDEALTYLDAHNIERIVHAYSDHISFPIMLEAPDEDETENVDTLDEKDEPEDEPSGPKQLNSGNALWARPKAEINEQDYVNFYKQVSASFDEPLVTLHYQAEGRHEYSVLVFIPTMKPFDLYEPERKGRVKLYVKRVFITEDTDILPPFLRFVRGVIDSQDIPLNLSREMLQNNPIVESIRRAVTKKILSELRKTAQKTPDVFEKVWDAFGAVIKEGLYEAFEYRDEIYEIARFRSMNSKGWISLTDYVTNMHDQQKDIYYLTGESLERLNDSPLLEGFRARGIDVLLLCDQVDHFWVINSTGYDGKPFKSLTQGDAALSDIPLKEGEANDTDADMDAKSATLIAKLKQTLGEVVSDVQISKRLVTSPVCLVAPTDGPDRGLDKIINYSENDKRTAPVLEININHDLLQKLRAHEDQQSALSDFEDLSWLLLDQAKILEGELPRDPAKFSERLNRLLLSKNASS